MKSKHLQTSPNGFDPEWGSPKMTKFGASFALCIPECIPSCSMRKKSRDGQSKKKSWYPESRLGSCPETSSFFLMIPQIFRMPRSEIHPELRQTFWDFR